MPLTPKTVEMGTHEVLIVDKLYGPLIACCLRIAIRGDGEWVIEREVGLECDDQWEEMARFDCQESLNLDDDVSRGT